VNVNINEIARISNEFAAGAKKSASASESLSQLAVELDSLMSRFRVEENAAREDAGPVRRGAASSRVAPAPRRVGAVV
jgi:hypothetical protein